MTSIAVGLALLSLLEVGSSLFNIYLAMIPLATGMAISMTPQTSLIMSSVPLARAGVGSAMNDTTRELGGALGVAVLGSIVTSKYISGMASSIAGLPEQAADVADSGLSGALAVGQQIGGEQGAALVESARQAFVDGLGAAAIVGSIVVFCAAIAARLLLPRSGDAFTGEADDLQPGPDRPGRRRGRRRLVNAPPAVSVGG